MKKRNVLAIMMLGCVLTACGSEEKVIVGEVSNRNVEMSDQTGNGSEQTEAAETEKNEETAVEDTQCGYVFVVNGISIEIDAEAQQILGKLGDPLSVYESPSCAFGDLDRIYTFSGYEMDTYMVNDVEYISSIVFKDDTVETPEGVCIGNTVEQIKTLYGEPSIEEETILTYFKDQMKLCFIINDGTVVSIEYRNMVLDE